MKTVTQHFSTSSPIHHLREIFGVLLVLSISPAQAQPVIDQSFDAGEIGYQNSIIAARYNAAQTFTVGIAGTLTRVDVPIARNSAVDSDLLTLDIRTTTATGAPTEPDSGPNILTSLTLQATAIPQQSSTFSWVTFNVPGVAVTVGEQLAIAMTTAAGAVPGGPDDTPFVWNESSGAYPGGGAFNRGVSAASLTWGASAGMDYGFRTWVDPVPEPSSFCILALGGLATLASSFRRKTPDE